MVSLTAVLQRVWHFIWHEDSFASWLVNLVLAFVLVKFLVYPGLGLLLGTHFPIVAVVSGSMEHRGLSFDDWWERSGAWYEEHSLSKEEFAQFSFVRGFNKGDIMVLRGIEPEAIKRGDVVVYRSQLNKNPIIHRVVAFEGNQGRSFITKGDNNAAPDRVPVDASQIAGTGKAVMRLPYLGWIKIWFVSLIGGA